MKSNMSPLKKEVPTDGILSPTYPKCPFRNIITRFGDKWSLIILMGISGSESPIRFSELERHIPDISSRVLSSCLRTLEADNLVSRKVYPVVPPKVEYTLTEVGSSLIPHLQALASWANDHYDEVINHRIRYNKR